MAKQTIDIGSAYDDASADLGRDAFDKCNDNFTELYAFNPNVEYVEIFDIGAWNMDTNEDVQVNCVLPAGAVITGLNAVIFDDNGAVYPINYGTTVAGKIEFASDVVTLTRAGAGFFDSTDFNSAANRGKIRISYVIEA